MKIMLLLLVSLCACTPAQKDWRNNTSIDVGVGADSTDVEYTYPYLGMSYYISHGFSASVGAWTDFYGNMGPYWGANWSFVPFERK